MRRQLLYVFNHSSLTRSHDLTESTRAMAKRGSDDLKKLAAMQAMLVRRLFVLDRLGGRY